MSWEPLVGYPENLNALVVSLHDLSHTEMYKIFHWVRFGYRSSFRFHNHHLKKKIYIDINIEACSYSIGSATWIFQLEFMSEFGKKFFADCHLFNATVLPSASISTDNPNDWSEDLATTYREGGTYLNDLYFTSVNSPRSIKDLFVSSSLGVCGLISNEWENTRIQWCE